MSQILHIIELVTYLGGIVGLAGGVIVRLAQAGPFAARSGFEFGATCFLCAIASHFIAASPKPAEEEKAGRSKAAAA